MLLTVKSTTIKMCMKEKGKRAERSVMSPKNKTNSKGQSHVDPALGN